LTQPDPLKAIRAISFDGDDTLWDFQSVMRSSLGHALEELRRHVRSAEAEALTIERAIEIREGVFEELRDSAVRLEEVRRLAFIRLLESIGHPDTALAERLNALYMHHRFADITLYPDVLPTLAALGSRYTLGLISNGNTYPQRIGLEGRFRFVIFAQDVGAAKPDARPFHAALGQLGLAPHELLHVGDSLRTDVAGARGVGALSVWLNREGRAGEMGIEADYEVRTLGELVGMME
jgi:HAD superfamily hydrolase (TIGR01509 family)